MFLNYINNFRGIAILYVIVIHCVSAFEWENSRITEKILRAFLSNGTILFVFIAGYLFQHLSKKYEAKSYLYKKLLYVVFPYLICSVPAIIYFTLFAERWDVPADFYENPVYMQVVLFYLTGSHLAPYWFIPMIALYYLISPLLDYLGNKNWFYCFLPVFILISLYIHRGGTPFQNFVHFFSVYVFGMFCSREKETINPLIAKNWVILINLAIIFVLMCAVSLKIYPQGASYLEKMFASLFYISVLYKYKERIGQKFSLLASTSFGIYFIHSYLISGIKLITKTNIGRYFHGNLLNFAIFSAFIACASVLIVHTIQKVLGSKSRYLIGS